MSRQRNYTEEDMQGAQEAVKNGVSLVWAEKIFGVPRETLRGRLQGAVEMADAMEAHQRLSHSQEERLCEWMCHVQNRLHARLTDKDLKEFAHKILVDDDDPDALEPFGKNWVKSFLHRVPKAWDVRANTKYLGPLPRQNLLYENEVSFQWRRTLYFQRELFELAKNDPGWTSVSKFDFPGAPQTYHAFKCGMMHFKLGDGIWSGRFFRKAFQALPDELSGGGLNAVQDVCLNILGALSSRGFIEIGTRMLRFCSELNAINPERHLYRNYFATLSQTIGRDPVQSDYCLWQLTRYYALELKLVRGSCHRSTEQAQRRHCLVVRDTPDVVNKNKAKDLITTQQALLTAAILSLGKAHDKTLRIQNEMFRVQHHARIFSDNYIAEIEASICELEQLYKFELGNVPFESWHEWHRSAYLRFLERMFDYYRLNGNVEKATGTAQWIVTLEGYQTTRWIYFALEFEYWLRETELTDMSELYKQQRLGSGYYQNLEREFVG